MKARGIIATAAMAAIQSANSCCCEDAGARMRIRTSTMVAATSAA